MNKPLPSVVYGDKIRPNGVYGPSLVERRQVDDGFGNLVLVTEERPYGLAFIEYGRDQYNVILDTQRR